MAVLLQITYQKKLGLPNYSSHSVSVSVQVEVPDVNQVPDENARLYSLLQSSVDKEIQAVGYLPDATKYGMSGHSNGVNGNGRPQPNGNGHHHQNGDAGISEKQIDLINRIVKEHNVNKSEVDAMAVEMFGGGVRTLNRMQASNLIDELFGKYPKQRGKFQRSQA